MATTKLDPSSRTTLARIAAHESWAQCKDVDKRTRPGRKAFDQRFYDQVDPDGSLPPEVRERMVAHARTAYFSRLALKSAKVRAAKGKVRKARVAAAKAELEAIQAVERAEQLKAEALEAEAS